MSKIEIPNAKSKVKSIHKLIMNPFGLRNRHLQVVSLRYLVSYVTHDLYNFQVLNIVLMVTGPL